MDLLMMAYGDGSPASTLMDRSIQAAVSTALYEGESQETNDGQLTSVHPCGGIVNVDSA